MKMKLAFKSKDLISGGLADKKKPSDFNPAALAKGIKVELEHTYNKAIAKEIASDHLTEDPHYYTKLEKMEKSAFWMGFEKRALKPITVYDRIASGASKRYGGPKQDTILAKLKDTAVKGNIHNAAARAATAYDEKNIHAAIEELKNIKKLIPKKRAP